MNKGFLKQRWKGTWKAVRRGVSKARREGVAGQQAGTMSVIRKLGPASVVLVG